jgi:hypothetical protein
MRERERVVRRKTEHRHFYKGEYYTLYIQIHTHTLITQKYTFGNAVSVKFQFLVVCAQHWDMMMSNLYRSSAETAAW